MLKSNVEYKEQAKQLMVGKYKNVILILICFSVAISLITGLFSNGAWKSIASLVDLALTAGMSYALVSVWQNVIAGKESDLKDTLLVGFKTNYVKTLLVHLLSSFFIGLFMILLIVPGFVKMYKYSLVYYLLHKEPQLEDMKNLKRSEVLMNGHKMDLFKLDLSYLGWYVLGIFTAGLLWLWVAPKHQTARMLFLNDLYAAAPAQPVIQAAPAK
jgi:uncharacterized membrane protein